jgi:hypothetical protein
VLSHEEQREKERLEAVRQRGPSQPLSVAAADPFLANEDQWDDDDELFEL